MFGFKKSPANKPPKNSDPFDSDTEIDKHHSTITPARRTSSEPVLPFPDDDDDDYFGKGSSSVSYGNKNKKQDFDSMSVQDLESYAVKESQETTKSVNNCLKIAEDIKQDATRTLDTLHQQGEQIHRTHMMAVDIDRDLSKGEKLLNNLGGMFSKPWRPKKSKNISGPTTSKDDNHRSKGTTEQRAKLGLGEKGRGSRAPLPEQANAMQKVEYEKAKQDDSLGDLSDILGDLKGMAMDMGSELDKQNKALDPLQADVEELSNRMKGANTRARRLVG